MIVEKTLDGSIRLTVTRDEYEKLYVGALVVIMDADLSPDLRAEYSTLASEMLVSEMRAGLMELGQ